MLGLRVLSSTICYVQYMYIYMVDGPRRYFVFEIQVLFLFNVTLFMYVITEIPDRSIHFPFFFFAELR